MTDKITLHQKLVAIQQELKAPKNQFNGFGKYKYRSLEDILEAVKPLLKEHKLVLTLDDEIVNVGEFNYVQAIARLSDGNEVWQVKAYARESVTKKGMDDSQITGSTSSYARKYALNGLFAIDDSKDADSTNDHGKTAPKPEVKNDPNLRTEKQVETIKKLLIETRIPVEKMREEAGSIEGKELTKDQAAKVITWLNGVLDARGEVQ
jgi:hypothetical protein